MKKNQYVRQWRVTERGRRRHNSFISDYIKVKFENIYHEALCFFNALNEMYPEKLDLRKTREYRNWKQSVKGTNNPESNIIVQTLITTTETTVNEGNQNEIIRFTTQTVMDEENSGEESDMENISEQSGTENSGKESDTENISEQSGTENNDQESDTENISEQSGTENNDQETQVYNDNLLLRIPLQDYTTNPQPQPSAGDDFQPFTDERLQEIMDELRNDPDLQNIFIDPHPENIDQDEGIELPSLEEEVELDFEPFDYRLEVELAEW